MYVVFVFLIWIGLGDTSREDGRLLTSDWGWTTQILRIPKDTFLDRKFSNKLLLSPKVYSEYVDRLDCEEAAKCQNGDNDACEKACLDCDKDIYVKYSTLHE